MQIFTLTQTHNLASIPPLIFLQAGCPFGCVCVCVSFLPSNQQRESTKGNVQTHESVSSVLCCVQEKYTRVMRDKADLIDKSERLEHIVLQLQGETDTIGQSVSQLINKSSGSLSLKSLLLQTV